MTLKEIIKINLTLTMVCLNCSNKLEISGRKLITPEFTSNKVRSSLSSNSSNSDFKVNQNMMLNKRKFAFDPMSTKCLGCLGRVENKNKYCLTCAYTKGLCEMCGKKISDTSLYKFTDVDPRDSYRKKKMAEKTKNIFEQSHSLDSTNIIKSNRKFEIKKIKFKEDLNTVFKLEEPKIIQDSIEFTDNLSDEYDEIIKI